MKTNELTGKLLDHWVARAEGMDKRRTNYVAYSSSWTVGGPIIEREIAALEHCSNDAGFEWNATNESGDVYWGSTALEAAMRAFVASKFGAEVPGETGSAA